MAAEHNWATALSIALLALLLQPIDATNLRCWGIKDVSLFGDGERGAYRRELLGRRSRAERNAPTAVESTSRGFSKLSVGPQHSCAIENLTYRAFCWGNNEHGQLGTGVSGVAQHSAVPAAVASNRRFSSIAAGRRHTCALEKDTNRAWCWGSNGAGELGIGPAGPARAEPSTVASSKRWSAITAGDDFTCAVEDGTGKLYCWGSNALASLGNPDTGDSHLPSAVFSGLQWKAVDAWGGTACGITRDGEAFCWGYNSNGEGGSGNTALLEEPTAVAGGRRWESIARGGQHTCAIEAETKKAWCWGRNHAGQRGESDDGIAMAPARVNSLKKWAALSAGGSHTCGIVAGSGGLAYCWGLSASGQVGDGTKLDRWTPTPVLHNRRWSDIAAGQDHTCGVAAPVTS